MATTVIHNQTPIFDATAISNVSNRLKSIADSIIDEKILASYSQGSSPKSPLVDESEEERVCGGGPYNDTNYRGGYKLSGDAGYVSTDEFEKLVVQVKDYYKVPSVRYTTKQVFEKAIDWSLYEVCKVYSEPQKCFEADMFSHIPDEDPRTKLYATACMLNKINKPIMTPQKMFALVYSMNKKRCKHSITEREVMTIAKNAYYSNPALVEENSEFRYVFDPSLNLTAAQKSVYIANRRRSSSMNDVHFVLDNWHLSEDINLTKLSIRIGKAKNFITNLKSSRPEDYKLIVEKVESIKAARKKYCEEGVDLTTSDAIKTADIIDKDLDVKRFVNLKWKDLTDLDVEVLEPYFPGASVIKGLSEKTEEDIVEEIEVVKGMFSIDDPILYNDIVDKRMYIRLYDSNSEPVGYWREDGLIFGNNRVDKPIIPISKYNKLENMSSTLEGMDFDEVFQDVNLRHKLDGDWSTSVSDMPILFEYMIDTGNVPQFQVDGFGKKYYQLTNKVRWYKDGYLLGREEYNKEP